MPSANDHEDDPPQSDVSELSLDDGGLIIYDPENDRAWVQSDAPIHLRAQA